MDRITVSNNWNYTRPIVWRKRKTRYKVKHRTKSERWISGLIICLYLIRFCGHLFRENTERESDFVMDTQHPIESVIVAVRDCWLFYQRLSRPDREERFLSRLRCIRSICNCFECGRRPFSFRCR